MPKAKKVIKKQAPPSSTKKTSFSQKLDGLKTKDYEKTGLWSHKGVMEAAASYS